MKLLTVGDSFTYGEELSDVNNAWPYLLGEMIGYEVLNLGKPGSGNTSMVRNVLNHYTEVDLVIIAWSHYSRLEFADECGTFDIWPGYSVDHHPDVKFRKVINDYIIRYHDDTYSYNQYLNNIVLLQHFLASVNKKYIMLDTFSNMDDRHLGNKNINDIVDTSSYLGWPYESMQHWAYPCEAGPGKHFLDEGHQKVANTIYNYIKELGWT